MFPCKMRIMVIMPTSKDYFRIVSDLKKGGGLLKKVKYIKWVK